MQVSRWCHCQLLYFICICICICMCIFIYIRIYICICICICTCLTSLHVIVSVIVIFRVKNFHRASDPRHLEWCRFDVGVGSGDVNQLLPFAWHRDTITTLPQEFHQWDTFGNCIWRKSFIDSNGHTVWWENKCCIRWCQSTPGFCMTPQHNKKFLQWDTFLELFSSYFHKVSDPRHYI